MPKKQIFLIVAAFIAIVAGLWWARTRDAAAPGRPAFPHSTLSITRADGTIFPFAVEVALSDSNQAYGLMFVRSMPAGEGMIFPYNPPREVAFWMKDTLIPLDMIFVRPDHTVGLIVANARPQDVTPISSQEPVSAVIEINGGEAKKDGIAVGDRVKSASLP